MHMTETGSMDTLWLTLQCTAPLCQAELLASFSGSCRLTEDKGLWSCLGIISTQGDTDGLA